MEDAKIPARFVPIILYYSDTLANMTLIIEKQESISTLEGAPNTSLGAVVYTDGSCKGPSSGAGFTGWGAHGYLYRLGTATKPVTIDNHTLTNKGYVRGNIAHDDSIMTVEPTGYLDFFGSSLTIGTNNTAELQAAYNTLERLDELGVKVINIYTDSEYVRKGLNEWCKNWENNNWRKNDESYVSNHELWIRCYGKFKELKAKGIRISVEWVKGHNEVFGNTHADILAGIGTNHSIDRVLKIEFKISDVKGYWKHEVEKHPFINFKRIYFNSVKSHNVPGNYFQADTGGADLTIGKRIPETGLSVIRLTQEDAAIEAVKARQYEVAKEINAIIMMKLDRVFSKDVYPYLLNFGKYCLLRGKGNLNIDFFDRQPVTVEVNPTGLSLRAVESFNLLEDLLDKFIQFKKNGFTQRLSDSIQLSAHDITGTFYDKEDKLVKKDVVTKYTLKPEYVVGFTDMSIMITEPLEEGIVEVKVPLILGTDLLPRNSLKKLEDMNPSIYLITWRESKNSLRYATVIECDTGIGIWSNFFADRIFFSAAH